MAKSFLSTLVGIAIDEGVIASVDDSITRYVPELARRDARFAEIRIRDLLTMSSGLRYVEAGMPWSDDAVTYYGVDLREVALERTEIQRRPNSEWRYNNFNPLLLGLVLEARHDPPGRRVHGGAAVGRRRSRRADLLSLVAQSEGHDVFACDYPAGQCSSSASPWCGMRGSTWSSLSSERRCSTRMV